MSDTHGTAEAPGGHEDAADAHAATPDHADDAHGHGGGHGHDDMALGPIDWPMWGVGALGVIVALVIAAAFVAATNFQLTA